MPNTNTPLPLGGPGDAGAIRVVRLGPSESPSPDIGERQVEKRTLELFFLALGMVFVLTLSVALLMVPVIFWQRAPQVLEDIWRKGFFGFLALSLLFDVYLFSRRMGLSKLRLELAKQRSDRELLLAAKKMDESLLRSIGEGVFAVDSHGRLILLNQRAEECTGVSEEKALSRPFREVLHFDKLGVEDFVERAMQTQAAVQVDGDAVLIKSDGHHISISVLASPVLENEQVRGCIVVFRDTTEQRALDKLKTEFISIASHQLRTPITGLRWYTAALAEGQAGALNPEQQELLKVIEGCVQHMVVLVDDLLDVARLDQGTLKVNLLPVSISEVLAEAARALEGKANKFQVSVVIDEGLASTPAVRADKALLTEVFRNLLDNAIKYTPEKGSVRMSAQRAEGSLIISVSDTGVGVPAMEMDRLFQKFSRIENPLSNRERGSGLGLYFAKGIIEKHGGRIWVSSNVGEGTTFYVRLPL